MYPNYFGIFVTILYQSTFHRGTFSFLSWHLSNTGCILHINLVQIFFLRTLIQDSTSIRETIDYLRKLSNMSIGRDSCEEDFFNHWISFDNFLLMSFLFFFLLFYEIWGWSPKKLHCLPWSNYIYQYLINLLIL